ncbi:MAG: sigma-70 family RNA polymerase sigma factor [Puniceicoccales bacterium]|jgi:RNA polymerase sigma-70 factor (ECF subfamily)|nr:sigma-70 family RNA polymerase sigma factor [Puniceicoccales bacterium]
MHDNPGFWHIKTLFLAEEPRMLQFATKLTGNFATAQDIVQDAFLRLHQHQATVAQPRAWLFTTIRHLALNHRRKHARLTTFDPASEFNDADDSPAPADKIEHIEALFFLSLCLDQLPPNDRLIIKLKFEDNLSYDDIARQTGLTRTNVGFRLHTTLKKITADFHRARETSQPKSQQA